MKRLLIALFAPFLLGGCATATLNKSECRNADWNMIGMEDGARGLPASNIGNHRKACAKYNLTPDFAEYRSGYEEGVQQFCTEAKGFEMGRKGLDYNSVCTSDLDDYRSGYEDGIRQFCTETKGFEVGREGRAYNGICPSDLEAPFLEGYNEGVRQYKIISAMNNLSSQIDSDKKRLRKYREDLKEKEDELVRSTSEADRARLLNDIKELQFKAEQLRDKIADQEDALEIKKEESREFD